MRTKLLRRLPLIIGGIILGVFLLWSIFPQAIAPYHPKEMFAPWLSCTSVHLLGTDDMGYDIFSQLVYAASSTMTVGLLSAFVSLTLGTAIGLGAGWLTGWGGEFLSRLIDVFLLIPMLLAAIILAAYAGPSINNIILIISILGWCSTARGVRAKTVKLKNSEFTEALALLGIPKSRILLLHILPNLSEVIWSRYLLSITNCMMTEASLSFMGLAGAGTLTWGSMVSMAFKRGGFSGGILNWYLPPGLCITLCVLGFYLVNLTSEHSDRLLHEDFLPSQEL